MEMDLDVNKIFAEYLKEETKEIISSVKSIAQNTYSKFTTSFNKYISHSYKKNTVTKTLLYKDSSVDIDKLYVELNLSYKDDILTTNELINSLSAGNRYIISATAGAGKSFLAKKIFKSLISSKKFIPIFIELRNLNNTELGILDYLIEQINYLEPITKEILIYFLKKGKFCLILDGYDEIETSIKSKIDKEIIFFADKFLETPIILTTRPDETIESLTDFDVFSVMKLEKNQAIALIEKLDYDEKIKSKFIKQLDLKLYDKHSDFLSIPLLLTIMLITYTETAEIPEKMHIFYEQAFDTLFFRHDASKSMYKREIKSKLAIDDFKKILSILSISSYLKSEINFTKSILLEHIRKAKKLLQIDFSNEDYIYDLLKSVCILIQEGNYITYTHRSFQEYFSAYCITSGIIPNVSKILETILMERKYDNVLSLSFEINRELIEREFIIPFAEKFIEKNNKSENDIERLKICFKNIRATYDKKNDKHNYFVVGETKYWFFQMFFERMYSNIYKTIKPRYKKSLSKKAFKSIFSKEFCNDSFEEIIEMNIDNISIIESLGILDVHIKRIEFITHALINIKKKQAILLENFF